MRGTFANIRLRNRLVEGKEGPYTLHLPDGEETFIYDAAMRYRDEGVPLLIIAGKEYGSGSSRDWAAKGTALLGIRAVIAESYERIHRSNLVGMGVLPLQFLDGETAASIGLTGREAFTLTGIADIRAAPGGDRDRPLRRGRVRAPVPARSPGSTARSRWSTCARAGSCRRCCGGSPRPDRRPASPSTRRLPGSNAKPPEGGRGLRRTEGCPATRGGVRAARCPSSLRRVVAARCYGRKQRKRSRWLRFLDRRGGGRYWTRTSDLTDVNRAL